MLNRTSYFIEFLAFITCPSSSLCILRRAVQSSRFLCRNWHVLSKMSPERKKLFNIIILGFGFMFMFTAFQTCGNIEVSTVQCWKSDTIFLIITLHTVTVDLCAMLAWTRGFAKTTWPLYQLHCTYYTSLYNWQPNVRLTRKHKNIDI